MRRLDWPERMADALDAIRDEPFEESYHCAAFAADVVLAITDVDPLPVRFPTIVEQYRAMLEDHSSIEEAIEAAVGKRVPVAFARRGDVVLRADKEAIGICCGQDTAFLSDGLAFLPTLDQLCAFRVG